MLVRSTGPSPSSTRDKTTTSCWSDQRAPHRGLQETRRRHHVGQINGPLTEDYKRQDGDIMLVRSTGSSLRTTRDKTVTSCWSNQRAPHRGLQETRQSHHVGRINGPITEDYKRQDGDIMLVRSTDPSPRTTRQKTVTSCWSDQRAPHRGLQEREDGDIMLVGSTGPSPRTTRDKTVTSCWSDQRTPHRGLQDRRQ